MKPGNLVREVEKNPDWILYGGTPGVILRASETVAGHWWVLWGNGFTHLMWDKHIEVLNESR